MGANFTSMMGRIKTALPPRMNIVCNGVKLGTASKFIKSVTLGPSSKNSKLAHVQANALYRLDELIRSGIKLKTIKGQDLAKFQAAVSPVQAAVSPATQTKAPVLSKTNFLNGLQCLKLLFWKMHRKAEIPSPNAGVMARFKEGTEVGKLAQKLFPNGIELERDLDPKVTDRRASEALRKGVPLFEAGFTKDRVYSLADILDIDAMPLLSVIAPVKGVSDLRDLIEVKATTKVKDVHLIDVAFQRYVYEKRGIKIRKCFLMHLNPEYVKSGKLDLNQLFIKEDVTAEVDKLMSEVPEKADAMLKVIDGKEPKIGIGQHCKKPYECSLKEICWKLALPSEDHVLMLYRAGKQVYEELVNKGIVKMADIPEDFKLSKTQQIQAKAHVTGETQVNKNAIREFLGKLVYPLYFLDFETIAPAVPLYDGSHPYEEIPFQFSLHVVERPGAEPIHHSFLAPGKTGSQLVDPRPEIFRLLKEQLGSSGSIVAYNAAYEQKCLEHMARAYPENTEWFNGLASRFADLWAPFRSFDYYNPKQKGSTSMKYVLPALTGITYEGMEIANGQAARDDYMRVTFEKNIKEEDRQRVLAALLPYCGQDTHGMIDIILALKVLVR